jgi:hypothetical protein
VQIRRSIQDLGESARGCGVEILVFKGAHLAAEFGLDPIERPFGDGDVLVRSGRDADRLVEFALRGAFVSCTKSLASRAVVHSSGATVDLQTRVLPLGFGRFDLAALFRRAHACAVLGGALVPDALDAAVIAIAHTLKDAMGKPIAQDLAAIESSGAISPQSVAERLASHGLRRAGLLVFAHLNQRDPGKWDRWLASVEPSKTELRMAIAFWRGLELAASRFPRSPLVLAPLGADGVCTPVTGAVVGACRVLRLRIKGIVPDSVVAKPRGPANVT